MYTFRCIVIGFLREMMCHLWNQGEKMYFNDPWNVYFLITQLFFWLAFFSWGIGIFAFNTEEEREKNEKRWNWESYNHVLFAETFYCIATMLALLRSLQIFQLHSVWGPMQLTLLRTGRDILNFVIIFLLFVFCCACGIQMLYTNYQDVDSRIKMMN